MISPMRYSPNIDNKLEIFLSFCNKMWKSRKFSTEVQTISTSERAVTKINKPKDHKSMSGSGDVIIKPVFVG